ncbi:mycofactocin biosynthesis glycosyltransferase MftF [Lacisediminihabitans profunda]|uniref:Mycofactocin system glycosyltransferase n=1 Tax=Lacisediminihabitans profunda TaxID=2594790 RepID=A0A5C8UTV1_9MICO|nr:mycofactocin biosynthesis glycosyltransferase MftF [Lacisediminihabitans profunda]TXN31363.1 mycofactocin system glycosyltransferase [Lacisediminihabitans profunda]
MTQPAAPPDLPLPPGFTVRLGRTVRSTDGGRALIGGAPTRVLYLTPAAVGMIEDRVLTVTSAATAALADRLLETGIADPVVDRLPRADESRLTVVVPVHGRPAALDRLLASLGPNARVVVVDDCSPAPEPIAAVVVAHGAELVRLEANLGPAGARNAGLARVTTEFVAFIDDDVVVEPGALSTMLGHFADPRVALVGPRILGTTDEEHSNWIGRYEQARSSLDLGRHPGIVRPRAPVSWLPGACLVARVSAIGEGFAPGLRVAEDVDLVWRLAELGWRVRFEPAASVRHEHRVTLVDWLSRKAFYGTGAQALAARHPRSIAPVVLAPWSVGVILALLAQRRWSIPVALGISAVAAARIARRLGRSEHPARDGVWLVSNGVVAALAQGAALLLRHWWPLAAVGCLVSRRMRRAVLVAAIADAALEYRRTDARLEARIDPLRFGLARRLDDLAYGAGVWLGAIRGRSFAPLRPDIRVRDSRSEG